MAGKEKLTTAALRIIHVPTEKEVQFFQIKMTGFSDTVTPSWNEEPVYGRMDPIATYQGTTRAIELSFDLGPFSESDERKKLALQKVSRLMQFQYPTYSGTGNAMSISRPPILRVSFANYIRDGTGTDTFLLCYMTGMSYNPIDGMSALSTPKVILDFNGKNATILPQRIAVTLSLNVLHEVAPGWDENKKWLGGNHWGPYHTPDEGVEIELIPTSTETPLAEQTKNDPSVLLQEIPDDFNVDGSVMTATMGFGSGFED